MEACVSLLSKVKFLRHCKWQSVTSSPDESFLYIWSPSTKNDGGSHKRKERFSERSLVSNVKSSLGLLLPESFNKVQHGQDLCYMRVRINNSEKWASPRASGLLFLSYFPHFSHLHPYWRGICCHHTIQVQEHQVEQIVSLHLAWHLSVMLWLQYDT